MWSRLFHDLFPCACCSCGRRMAEAPWFLLCADCGARLPAVDDSMPCKHCGKPLISESVLCMRCRLEPPPYRGGRSLWWYEGPGESLLRAFKFQGDLGVAPFLAAMTGAWLQASPERPTLVCPVPPHPWSAFRRGFDPVDRVLGLVSLPPWVRVARLIRRRSGGKAQKTLDAEARRGNLARVLVPDMGEVRRAGRGGGPRREERVILLDDIFTTGATMEACAGLLRGEGWEDPGFLTFFRD